MLLLRQHFRDFGRTIIPSPETSMDILLMAHSGLRWLVLLIAVIAIVKFLAGWMSRSRFTGMDRGLMAGFSGLMDLQVMLGLILLVWSGMAGAGFPLYRIAHGSIMILAGVVAHLSVRWRNAEDLVRFRSSLFLIVGSIILVLLGIVVLPGGLSR